MREGTMLKRSPLALLFLGYAAFASAEPAWVTDSLRLSLYAEADGSGDPLETLVSGAALEILERNGGYARVRTTAGREGWVRAAYLVTKKPALARVAELEAEIEDLKNDVAAARDAQHAAEGELSKLTNRAVADSQSTESLQDTLVRLQRENEEYEQRLQAYRLMLPMQWVAVALVVVLIGGFLGGLWWLDALIRRRHGGFRIY
jgi:SH3 domain protein